MFNVNVQVQSFEPTPACVFLNIAEETNTVLTEVTEVTEITDQGEGFYSVTP